MKQKILPVLLLALAFCWPHACLGLGAEQQEYVTTSPEMVDGVLYVASSTYPQRRGHLRAINLLSFLPTTLWDAAEKMPLAGADDTQPDTIQKENQLRSLLTNVADQMLPLAASSALELQLLLGVDSLLEAETLLHAVRGRRGGSASLPAGASEDPQRLWSISRSSPVVVGRSLLNPAAVNRDRVLYVGADDGMLHAFLVSSRNAESESYLVDDPDGGVELWAYLPGSFLPSLQNQPLNDTAGELAISLDGTPLVREVYLDLDGDGLRRWHTLLVATGTILQERRSSLFVFDITDPYQPKMLWERLLPGEDTGRTRGVTLGPCGSSPAQCIYLSADFVSEEEAGMHVLAIDLAAGSQLWRFTSPYPEAGPVASATPAVPVLADFDGDDKRETLVLGDLVGQLWGLDLKTGQARGGEPLFVVAGGAAEPIGAGVAVLGNLVVFGTGGVEEADSSYQYALYAVDVLPDGGRLRWTYPLASGEKVWQAPTIDQSGNLLLATSLDYLSLARSEEQPTSGRVVALNRDGEETASHDTDAATIGRVVAASEFAVSVDLTGEVTHFGSPSQLTGPTGDRGSVKVLSWRQR